MRIWRRRQNDVAWGAVMGVLANDKGEEGERYGPQGRGKGVWN